AEGGVEAGVERLLQRLRRQPGRFLAVVREVHEAGDQRPRVRAAQRLLAVKVVEQITNGLLIERHALPVALVAQDAAKGLRGWVADSDLVGHAAQEGFVDELRWRQVRGEDNLAKEWQLDLAAGSRQVEVVDLLLHRHDESIEKSHGGYFLAAEVVDHEHARVGLPLQRRFVIAVGRVIGEVELLQLELAARDHDRPFDLDQAPVYGLGSISDLVIHGVDDADDLVADRNGMRNLD